MSSFGQPGDSTLNTDTFNLIPDKLPSHPCVFVNRVDLERSRQLIQEGGWANVALQRLLDAANVPFEMPGSLAEKAIPDQNARILTHAKRQILAFHLTGKQEYYDRALTVFQQIASAYLTWPLIDDHIRAMNYGLAESRFTINLAQVYDLLTAVEPDVKDRDLFLKALARTQDTTDRCQHKTCGNHNTWNLAARLAAGLAMGRLESLSEVLYGWEFKGTQRYGLVHQLRHDILSDGLHWERTPGYHYYTLMAIVEVVVMLEHAGIDLWHTHLPSQQENEGDDLHRAYGPAGTKSLKAAFDAPFYQTTGNGDLCLLHDSGLANLRGVWIWGPLYELAYQAYEDPKYAWLLNRIDQDYQNHPERKYPELPMSLQPPAGEFDFLRLHQREIPEGSFSLSENCPISLEGTHKNHCTLFPTTGAGILRHSPGTTDPAVHFFWGPHSAGHQSPAALHVDLHALGRRITNAPDAGGYEDPMHLTWVRTTIAHNTVTVDETPMFPYDREEDSIWRADNRREHVSDSVLEFFKPGEEFQTCRASNEQVYPGVRLDRTLVLTKHFLIDLFRVTSEKSHQYDYAMHILGTPQLPEETQPVNLGEQRGYRHFSQPKTWKTETETNLTWNTKIGPVKGWTLLPEGANAVVAKDPVIENVHAHLGALESEPPRSNLIVRAKGTKLFFLSLWQFGESNIEAHLEHGQPEEEIVVQTQGMGRNDRWVFPWQSQPVQRTSLSL